MESTTSIPPEFIIKMIRKRGGRDIGKGLGMLINWAEAHQDRTLIHRSIRFTGDVVSALKKAMPEVDPELIGSMVAALTDLWETGQTLDKELKKLAKLRLPQDRERLRDTLVWLDAIQVDMASYWIREVRRDLPRLLDALNRQERNGGPKPRKKLTTRRVAHPSKTRE